MKKQGQLTNEIRKLQYQLSYSEHINKQLSAQLSTFCQKLGITPSKFKQTSDINLINTQIHLQQLYYVEPLLMCYQQTITLLKTELEETKEQAKGILQNTEKIVNENNFIRKELQSKIQLLTKADNLGLNLNFLNLENKDLKDKISIINAKNQFLVRKNKELSYDYEKLKNQNLSLFDHSEIQKLEHRAKQELKQKQAQIINCKSEIQILRNQLNNEQSIVADLEKKNNQMDNQIIKLKNEVKVIRQQLENNQTIQERVKENLEAELLTVKDQLSVSQRKEQELFTKCMSLESQLQDKSNKIHNINVQNSQLQTNNSNMLQMLQSYEVKVSTLNKKIKKLETDVKEMSEEKAEYTKRAEISQWKLAQKNEEMQRKEAEWKKQKSRIAKMWEDRMQAMRKNYDAQSIPTSNKP